MNIAIVDDDQQEIDKLKEVLRDYSATNRLNLTIDEFTDPTKLVENYTPYQYTVIFMDIYMDDMDGIAATAKIREKDTNSILIFLTSSDEHMLDAFSFHAFDYIPKPANKKRLFKVMDDVLKKTSTEVNAPQLSFTYEKQNISIKYSDLLIVKSQGHYVEIIDNDLISYSPRMTFSSVEDILLQDKRFCLIMRGIIVNMDHIIDIKDNTCFLSSDINVPISIKNFKKIQQIWQNYTFETIRSERKTKRQ